jgi:nicotinamidase-related amidase
MQCLICVNIQDKFINEIEDANEIIPVVNELLTKFNLVIFTLEPPNSYKESLYPLIHKGIKIENIWGDFYFFKDHLNIPKFIKKKDVTDVFICGLPLDTHVARIALNMRMYFNTIVIEDATKPSNPNINETLKSFKKDGIKLVESWELSQFMKYNLI